MTVLDYAGAHGGIGNGMDTPKPADRTPGVWKLGQGQAGEQIMLRVRP